MLTISNLARRYGLSRSTILYYESIGLLKPAGRTAANYRRYTDQDLDRLQLIRSYRDAGLTLDDIQALLEQPDGEAAAILKRRLTELDAEIASRRRHQRDILRLLKGKISFEETKMMTKEKWVSIMRAAGFTDDDMHRWHREFERSAPEDHEEFLVSLNIPTDEIARIREWSRPAR